VGGKMNITQWVSDLQNNQLLAVTVVLIFSAVLFIFTRYGIARWLTNLAKHTSSKVDDILVRNLRPNRMAWLAPLTLVYTNAYLFPQYENPVAKTSLFLILWLSVLTLTSLLDAINEIYESRKNYNGVSIQSYLDITKILIVMVGFILSITLLTGESPVVLLTGLGAITAVLLLIFQNTILSLVASIQIVANDLIKEGDWIEVPSYDADGDVVNINLHTIKIRNFDMTYSIIPTYKIVDVSYKNWRGMKESGARRIMRSLSVDMNSIKFCNTEMLARLRKIDLIEPWLKNKIAILEIYQKEHADHYDSPLDGPQITNIEIFRTYIAAYLKNRPDIASEGLPFLVRALAPNPAGLPIELYVFTKKIQWENYEGIQAEIFDHLLAAAQAFDLRVFQQPTGLDFSTFAKAVRSELV
jgi:miniconductance mechanosensitive channel